MNIDFWPTIAQISATFIGLVFVGLSFYLNSLHQAVEHIQAETRFSERSTLLIQVSVVSNLCFFLLPLIVSIHIMSSENLSSLWWFLTLGLILLGVVVYLNEFTRESREQLHIILEERNSSILRLRLKFGKLVMYLVIIIILVVVIALRLDRHSNLLWEDVIRLIAGFSIIIGISYGILDITLFDSNNIIFYITPEERDIIINKLSKYLQSEMYEVERSYNRFATIVESRPYKQKVEEMMRNPDLSILLAPEQIQEQEAEKRKRIDSQYTWLKTEVPTQGTPLIVNKIQSLGCYVSVKEIQEFRILKNNLTGVINGFKEMLGDRIIDLEKKLSVGENE